MPIVIDLQLATEVVEGQGEDYPTLSRCETTINQVFDDLAITETKECTIRIVSEEEGRELNQKYRGKVNATNILSFAFEKPDLDISHLEIQQHDSHLADNLLGDLVLCAKVVIDEAKAQKISEAAHWAHLLVHGTLHLLGYDHQNAAEAKEMEDLECSILKKLSYPNPYRDE